MSGEKYVSSNEEVSTSDSEDSNSIVEEKGFSCAKRQINTSVSNEDDSLPEEKCDNSMHLKTRIKRQQRKTPKYHCRQEIPSEDIKHKRIPQTANAYPTKKWYILSSWQMQQKMKTNIDETEITRSSEIDSNYSNTLHGPTNNNYQKNTPLFSCPSNANPEEIQVANDHDGEIISTYICDEDLEDAGPSYVTCDVCNQTFDDEYLLEQHKPIHSSEKPISNEVSDHKFSETKTLKNHKLFQTEKKAHKCDLCSKTFSRKFDLTAHKNTHIDERPYECKKCFKRFTRKDHLRTHLLIHTGEKPYECEKCHKKFTQKSSLRTHLRIHNHKKPYECEICHKRFSQKTILRTHLRTHTGEKPYKCDKCGNSFSDQSYFIRHKKKCGSSSADCDSRQQCIICPKNYANKKDLMIHYRTHTVEKPYKCEICHKKFTRKYHLNRHYKIHTDRPPLECPKCGKIFSNRIAFSRHGRKCVFSAEKERK